MISHHHGEATKAYLQEKQKLSIVSSGSHYGKC